MSHHKKCVAVFAVAVSLLTTPLMAKSLRVNVTGDPAMMDPITYSELVAGRILDNVYEGFTDKTPDGKITKALATDWQPLATGNGFRISLRQGVKFHSGRPFTAKDVKYTYEALLTPGNKGGLNAQYLGNIVGAAEVK